MRLRQEKVKLTVCVDKVAASGDYMMACVADEVLATPFAVVGSIGVAALVPNLHRLLDKHGVDYDEMTSGEYKRTVSFLAEITQKGRAKFQEQLEETHELFKRFIQDNRSQLNMDEVATGEHWYGTRALEVGLVNALRTSDDYLLERAQEANVFELHYKKPINLRERFAGTMGKALEGALIALWSRLASLRFGA